MIDPEHLLCQSRADRHSARSDSANVRANRPQIMTTRPGAIVSLQKHPDFGVAVPTPDHFIPLLYLAGLAQQSGRLPKILVDGYALGSLSMTSYTRLRVPDRRSGARSDQ